MDAQGLGLFIFNFTMPRARKMADGLPFWPAAVCLVASEVSDLMFCLGTRQLYNSAPASPNCASPRDL
jgi:hypothetical protein